LRIGEWGGYTVENVLYYKHSLELIFLLYIQPGAVNGSQSTIINLNQNISTGISQYFVIKARDTYGNFIPDAAENLFFVQIQKLNDNTNHTLQTYVTSKISYF
jgi:hypothetical protein